MVTSSLLQSDCQDVRSLDFNTKILPVYKIFIFDLSVKIVSCSDVKVMRINSEFLNSQQRNVFEPHTLKRKEKSGPSKINSSLPFMEMYNDAFLR